MEVLKVIGIIVLCILVVAAALLLLLLFFPVRYRMAAKGRNEQIHAAGKAVWMFGLASLLFDVDKDALAYRLKIIGITVRKGQIDDLLEKGKQGVVYITGGSNTEKTSSGKAEDKPDAATVPVKKTKPQKPVRFSERLRQLPETLKKAYERASSIRNILETKSGRRTVKFLKTKTLELLNLIKPYIIKGEIRYGFDDAALTAIAYGPAADLAFRLADGQLSLIPQFTEKGVDLDMEMIGKFRIKPVLSVVFGTMSDEGVKRLFKVIRRIING